jgi:hypothetical protein
MLPLEVFERNYLVEYPSREIWLSEAEAWFPSDGLKMYTDGIFRSWNFRHCLAGCGLRHFGLFRILFEGVYDW